MDSWLLRVLSSVLVDASLAILCGLLLARLQLGAAPDNAIRLPSSVLPATALTIGASLQLLCLVAGFTGRSSLPALVGELPGVAGTHAGTVLVLNFGAALLFLCLLVWQSLYPKTPREASPKRALSGVIALLVLCLLLRAGVGHAATEAVFSLSQIAQATHLVSMAVWSGGVIVFGLLVLPRLDQQGSTSRFGRCLAGLSTSSTWAVAALVVSGAVRSFYGLGGDLHQVPGSTWGRTLLIKLVCVVAAVILGAVNRLRLRTVTNWNRPARARTVQVLRVEAFLMMLILALSSTLANLAQPGE